MMDVGEANSETYLPTIQNHIYTNKISSYSILNWRNRYHMQHRIRMIRVGPNKWSRATIGLLRINKRWWFKLVYSKFASVESNQFVFKLQTEMASFGAWDYVVLVLMLVISASIGIYFRFTGGKQKTNNVSIDYILWNIVIRILI